LKDRLRSIRIREQFENERKERDRLEQLKKQELKDAEIAKKMQEELI
jgi:hypothetical protein